MPVFDLIYSMERADHPVTRWKLGLMLLLAGFLVQGCGTTRERNAVPEEYSDIARIPGIPDARIWGDKPPVLIEQWLKESSDEEFYARYGGISDTPHYYLAMSGGGARGAYGAGILVGWSERGSRPEFTIVSGVSTGAMAAPFAFLGSEYDHVLEEISTSFSTKDVIDRRSRYTALWRESMADTAPLKELVANYIDDTLLEAIAAEHRKGRRLYMGTTNMDAGRPVLWNIGAIAVSGDANALALVRDIMLASTAIPGVFPPVYFEVTANGETYEEMHADGGTTTQVNLYPVGFDWGSLNDRFEIDEAPDIYVIRNAKLEPVYRSVEPRFLSITGRSIAALIRTQGIGDTYRIYIGARRDDMDYHLAYIPETFTVTPKEMFDPDYMRALFEFGRQQSLEDTVWHDSPPGVKSRKN